MFAPQKSPGIFETAARTKRTEPSAHGCPSLHLSSQTLEGLSRYCWPEPPGCRHELSNFLLCAREERPVCSRAHWEAPGKEENYRATHAGPVTPVWLTRKANSSTRNLSEARKKQLLFALGWGTEGGQGSRAPRWYLLGAPKSSWGKAGDGSG